MSFAQFLHRPGTQNQHPATGAATTQGWRPPVRWDAASPCTAAAVEGTRTDGRGSSSAQACVHTHGSVPPPFLREFRRQRGKTSPPNRCKPNSQRPQRRNRGGCTRITSHPQGLPSLPHQQPPPLTRPGETWSCRRGTSTGQSCRPPPRRSSLAAEGTWGHAEQVWARRGGQSRRSSARALRSQQCRRR